MTALDQAFIKAYVQHGGVPATALVEKARPVPLAEVLTERPSSAAGVPPEVRKLAVVRALEGIPQQRVGLPTTEALEELVRTPDRKTDGPAENPTDPSHEEPGPGRPCCRAAALPGGQAHLSVEDLEIPPAVCCFGPKAPTIPFPPAESQAATGAETGAGSQGEPPQVEAWAVPPPIHAPPLEPDQTAEAAPSGAAADEAFCPLLQTDRFDWPEVCRTLDDGAEGQIGRLADALEAGLGQGRKVVGLGGLRRGEGCTTLLLCAARQLARRGWNVLIVDADTDDPRLASRLGLAPEAGWQDVAAGRVPLDEAVIESVEDRLALLPCCGHVAERRAAGGDQPAVIAELQTLRRSYDLVLVDLGPPGAAADGEDLPAEAVAGAIDAVVLVHDVRSTSPEELARLQERLAAAGIAQAGVAENFVPARETTDPRTT